jgi:predicted phage tail protein
MQRVLLLDELGEKFGAVHEYYNLRTPVDAIKLLCINHPEFQKELIESGEKGIGYKVVQAGAEFELDDMLLPFGSNDLIITPVIAGSGRGFGKVLLGAALIGLAVATGGVSLGVTGFAGTAAAIPLSSAYVATTAAIAIAGNVGIALALSGVSQMLSPQPEGPLNIIGSSSQSGDRGPQSSIRGMDDAQSYAYRGPVNTVGAGAIIPLVFGQCIVGGHTITASVEVTDESDPLSDWIGKPGPHTMRVNGEKLDATFTQNEKASIGVKLKTWTEQLIPTRSPSGIADGSYTDESVTYLRTPGSGSDSGSTSIPLSGTSSEYDSDGLKDLGSITGESPSDARFDTSRFQMAFLLDNGLHDRAAGIGTLSTYIDGFITFQIVIKKDDTVVGTTQFTIQGMLLDTQDYRWAAEFSFAKIEHQDTYTVYAKLIDFGGDPLVNTLRVDYMGYNFLGD